MFVLIAVLLVTTLGACGKQEDTSSGGDVEPQDEVADDKVYTIKIGHVEAEERSAIKQL